jgi:hypothetical protein
MGILEKLFPAKTAITSATIKSEIDYSESEIMRLNAEIAPKLATIATLNRRQNGSGRNPAQACRRMPEGERKGRREVAQGI